MHEHKSATQVKSKYYTTFIILVVVSGGAAEVTRRWQ